MYAVGCVRGGTEANFADFSVKSNSAFCKKYLLGLLYHIHIWQVSPQLSCDDTCQIWVWYVTGHPCFVNYELWKKNSEQQKLVPVPPTQDPVQHIPIYYCIAYGTVMVENMIKIRLENRYSNNSLSEINWMNLSILEWLGFTFDNEVNDINGICL